MRRTRRTGHRERERRIFVSIGAAVVGSSVAALRSIVLAAWGVAFLTLAPVVASPLTAQVPWEGPRLMGSAAPGSFGAHFVNYATLPGDGMGVLVTWQAPGLSDSARFRGGFAEGAFGENSAFGGIDLWGSLARRSATLPVDLSWTTGVGAGVGEYAVVTVPLGVVAGRSWSAGRLWFSPYVHTGVGLDLRLGDRAPEERWAMSVAVDLGFMISLDPDRRFALSASAGLGDRQAVSLGVVIR